MLAKSQVGHRRSFRHTMVLRDDDIFAIPLIEQLQISIRGSQITCLAESAATTGELAEKVKSAYRRGVIDSLKHLEIIGRAIGFNNRSTGFLD